MDSESETFEKIGYSEDELALKRSHGTGFIVRYGALILFWALWIGMIGGATLIIIVNNHDITTTIAPLTTRAMKHAFSSDSQTDMLQAVPNSMAFNSMTSDNRIPKQAFMV